MTVGLRDAFFCSLKLSCLYLNFNNLFFFVIKRRVRLISTTFYSPTALYRTRKTLKIGTGTLTPSITPSVIATLTDMKQAIYAIADIATIQVKYLSLLAFLNKTVAGASIAMGILGGV
jgi:hypothetical protein